MKIEEDFLDIHVWESKYWYYCVSKKSFPFEYSEYTMKIGQYFLDIKYNCVSRGRVSSFYYHDLKMSLFIN